jgi:outer membrane protein TolC
MRSSFIAVLVGLMVGTLPGNAQIPGPDSRSPILKEYIRQGLEQNPGLTQTRLQRERQASEVREARGQYMPRLTFSADYTLADGGRTIDIPIGDLLNPVYSQLNQMQEGTPFPMVENESEQFLPNDFHETKLRLVQPVYNPDIYRNRRLQESLQRLESRRLESKRAELSQSIRGAYYDYLQARSGLAIYRDTRSVLEDNLQLNQSLYRNGKATQDVVFDARYELKSLEGEIARAREQVQAARAAFNQLLNRALEADIQTDTTLRPSPDTNATVQTYRKRARNQRPELAVARRSVEVREQALSLEKGSMMPRVNAVGDLGYQGFGYEFDGDQQFYLVNLGLRWDLFQGRRRKEAIEQARLQREESQAREEEVEDRLMVQVTQRYYAWRAAWQRLEAARAAETAARESFRIAQKRYQAQNMLWVSFQQARNRYTTARLERNIRRYEVLQARAALERAAGSDPYLDVL